MDYALQILKGIDVTDSILSASDVPETDYPTWDAVTNYPIGDTATGAGVVLWGHEVWVSLVNPNTNLQPDTSPTAWKVWRPANRWAMFDLKNSTATAQADTITVTLTPPSGVNAVWLGGLVNQTTITITQTHPTLGTLFTEERTFSDLPLTSSWYDWTFGTRTARATSALFSGLRPFPATSITITIEGGSALAVASCLLGRMSSWGEPVAMGATVGIRDYSRQKENEWGDLALTQGAYRKTCSLAAWVPRHEAEAFGDFLSSIRSTPALFIGHPDFASMQIFGVYEDWELVFSLPQFSDYNLKLRGFT